MDKPMTKIFSLFGQVWVFILFIQLIDIALHGRTVVTEPNKLILATEILVGSQMLIALIDEKVNRLIVSRKV